MSQDHAKASPSRCIRQLLYHHARFKVKKYPCLGPYKLLVVKRPIGPDQLPTRAFSKKDILAPATGQLRICSSLMPLPRPLSSLKPNLIYLQSRVPMSRRRLRSGRWQ